MATNDKAMFELLTIAERSGFSETGRVDEVERLCEAFGRIWPDAVRSFEYGRSAEGRPLRAMIVSRAGVLSPGELSRRGLPILMLQGGIHPGESDGKDAGFIALRQLLSDEIPGGLLERLAILFVPAFNTDGHERVGRWNRLNQNGPQETGWRTTAHNLNLNRDYTKADAPEMHAMLRLLNEWDPLVCADLHVTDGADFEPDISLQVEPINQGDPGLYASGRQLRDELIAKLAAQGSLPLPFYPDLASPDDPASGFQLTVYSPRFSTGYFPARNRFTVLVETHSWKDYATRVRITRNTLIGLTELIGANGAELLEEVHLADARAMRLGGTDVTLDFKSGWREPLNEEAGSPATRPAGNDSDPNVTMIDFRGYAYTREPSAISGELVTTYDPGKPQIWHVPLRNQVEPAVVARAPRDGYVVPAGYAQQIGPKLALHGIRFDQVGVGLQKMDVEVFRATSTKFSSAPFEGRMRLTLEGGWHSEPIEVPTGSLFVPIRQPKARLVMALLEPQAPDSFAAWGFFNGWFEQKEYMEPYVAEIIAREMLDRDAELAAQFKRKLADEPLFAASSSARLEFFHRRHASWDQRLNLYPIYRLR
ncbi:MAG TPA: M14 family zinc carboxypeptidase [Steroidobacteraceae bacterium]